MSRVRRNVATLTRQDDWPDVLVAYERAVGLMRAADPGTGSPTIPTGWRFQAAIHGRAGPDGAADTSNPLWSTCQHGSWFFLPWHRMYLAAFEAIVQHHLGDPDWSLPYWYAIDPDRPRRAVLPAAFRDTTRPDNNLHTRHRARRMNRGKPLNGLVPFEVLSGGLGEALAAGRYATPDGISTFGGGKRARPAFGGPEQGLLEGTPHGLVHVLVGNDINSQGQTVRAGWMGSFFTAALDPIFWLHHANLDRLWQVWLDLGHRSPRGQRAWVDTSFTFPAPEGGSVTWRVGDVLDTRDLGYEYDDVAPPSSVAEALGGGAAPAAAADGEAFASSPSEVVRLRAVATRPTEETDLGVPPRVLGAVDDVDLGGGSVEIPVAGGDGAGHTFLRVEGVNGTSGAPAYALYLGLPSDATPADRPDLLAGTLSSFGVAESSVRNDRHDGDGITATYDVTAVREVLEQEGRWSGATVRLSVAVVQPTEDDDLEELDDVEPGTPAPLDLRARRIVVLAAAGV